MLLKGCAFLNELCLYDFLVVQRVQMQILIVGHDEDKVWLLLDGMSGFSIAHCPKSEQKRREKEQWHTHLVPDAVDK